MGGPYEGTRLESVDPGGVLWSRIGPERALGCVVWQAAEIEACQGYLAEQVSLVRPRLVCGADADDGHAGQRERPVRRDARGDPVITDAA